MKIVEIRDLDGPNIFLLQPAIKIELALEGERDFETALSRLAPLVPGLGFQEHVPDLESLRRDIEALLDRVHAQHGQPKPEVLARLMETPGHVSIAYSWQRRSFGLAVAGQISGMLTGASKWDDAAISAAALVDPPDNRPLMITDAERRIPVIGVTGTNGKTTTTRLLAHMLMRAGKHVGWSSTSGVYIDGVEVMPGDYSGPAGARRAINDPVVDVAVVETARGGILLRGLACESNDVSVFTNVSPDHLNLHGVRTVEGLAEVKSVVVRTTLSDGTAVLNADDALVVASCSSIRASKLYFSCNPANPVVSSHRIGGGRAIVFDGSEIMLFEGEARTPITKVGEIPFTFNGRARHMVENAMAAAGAAIGLGLPLNLIVDGLRSFTSSAEQNPGRLNVFDRDGVMVILDFAHNESGLEVLLDFAHNLVAPNGNVIVMIGTAGDRTEESLREIGRLAAAGAQRVIVKRTEKYERGRSNDEMISLYREGAAAAGRSDVEVSTDEMQGLFMALEGAAAGDVIALMCQEHVPEIVAELRSSATAVN